MGQIPHYEGDQVGGHGGAGLEVTGLQAALNRVGVLQRHVGQRCQAHRGRQLDLKGCLQAEASVVSQHPLYTIALVLPGNCITGEVARQGSTQRKVGTFVNSAYVLCRVHRERTNVRCYRRMCISAVCSVHMALATPGTELIKDR